MDAFFVRHAYSDPESVHSVYDYTHFVSNLGNYLDYSDNSIFSPTQPIWGAYKIWH